MTAVTVAETLVPAAGGAVVKYARHAGQTARNLTLVPAHARHGQA